MVASIHAAREYLSAYEVAGHNLTNKISYQRAQNYGRALSECGAQYGKLEEKADELIAKLIQLRA